MDTFDYIVCGAGTTGPAVAARLAEDSSVTVLLIEAGPDNIDLENTHMVGGWSQNFDTEHDWNLVSEPNAAAGNRVIKLSRGKFLGGSSAVNGTLMVRGSRQDYDDWEARGNLGWGADKMWHYFNKSETFHTEDGFKEDHSCHGKSGPIHTSIHPYAPISNRVYESFMEKGFPFDDDMFARGTRAHGCGHCTRSVWKGMRMNGGEYIRSSFGDLRIVRHNNLSVAFNHQVTRVILDKNSQVKGVEVIKNGTKEPRVIKCRREVVLSMGSYGSPQVLLLSGIGPKEELYEVGIQPVADLPGVGRNLEDHLTVFMFYEVPQGLTTDHLLHGDGVFERSREEWRTKQAGTLCRSHFGAFAFTRLDERLKKHEIWREARTENGRDPLGLTPTQAQVEYFTTERYAAPKHYNNPPPTGRSAFGLIVENFSAKSRGYIKLRSNDPLDKPIIQHNYLQDPLDVLVLAEACKFGAEVIQQGKGTKDLIIGSWPPEDGHHLFTELSQWEDFVRKNATTCFHPSSTCKMGPRSDPGAVVDARLRVYGVKGLRVADCSIMPKLNNGHPQAVAYAIAEKCADMIKEDWKDTAKKDGLIMPSLL
ncbi:GMC oxidoreductase [Xylogone sp. PMI_703]|nr:GMC oxidoreductase [Xylogone sp. PMI_703]